MTRYFYALDIPNAAKQQLITLGESITPTLPQPTTLNNLHITLVFLGDVGNEQLTSMNALALTLASQINEPTLVNIIPIKLNI